MTGFLKTIHINHSARSILGATESELATHHRLPALLMTNFLSSSATKTVLETRTIKSQSQIESEVVPNALCNGGKTVANTCSETEAASPANRYLLVVKPILKTEVVLDLQFSALNIWKIAMTVKARV